MGQLQVEFGGPSHLDLKMSELDVGEHCSDCPINLLRAVVMLCCRPPRPLRHLGSGLALDAWINVVRCACSGPSALLHLIGFT
jgi:hypothetical protein